MQDSQLPTKFAIIFASAAPGGNVTDPIPTTPQAGGLVSFPTGWQTINFTPVDAGGVPPWGKDFNGLFKIVSEWLQWYQAGGPVTYDATFQANPNVNGYPNGAIVQSATTPGKYWRSSADNNSANPDTGGAGWAQWPFPIPLPIADGGTNNAGPFTLGSIIFSDGVKLTQDNANFYWLDSLNRLGIGTNAPNANIDVRGTILASGAIETTSGSANAVFAPNGGANFGGAGAFGNNLTVGGTIESTSGSPIAVFVPAGGGQFGGTVTIGGMLGVGTGAPTQTLDVHGPAIFTSTGGITINSSGPTGGLEIESPQPTIGTINSGNGNGWARIHLSSNDSLAWSFNTVQQMNLDGTGNLLINGALTQHSDITMKEDICDIGDVIDRVMRLRPIKFRRKGASQTEVGFSAQDVRELFPELVRGEDGSLSVAYSNGLAIAIKAIQELAGERQRPGIARRLWRALW